jgi:protein TonB
VQKPALLTRPVDTAPASQRLVHPPAPRTEGPRDARELSGDAARKAGEQISKQLFYPAEAIERGLQGETLVLLFLDESGNAVAARIEASSGHALLDEAAVRAARTLRSLPASAPREAIVPVRFRLR